MLYSLCHHVMINLDKEPDDQLTLETVFENKENMERWLAFYLPGTSRILYI